METDEATIRLRELIARAERQGIPRHRLRAKLLILLGVSEPPRRPKGTCSFMLGVLSITVAFAYIVGIHTHAGLARVLLQWQNMDIHMQKCAINMPQAFETIARPPEDCSFCHHVFSVDKRFNLSPAEFEKKYAYSGRPVVVTDGMTNWTAYNVFNYEFFKGLYEKSPKQDNCQFFPYKTAFSSLKDVFKMTKERAEMVNGTEPWYIGWCNCEPSTGDILRKHYKAPYFLPKNAENTARDWIFMGSPGYGAQMHIDRVDLPSWQAQIRGKKKWILQPPPECLYECKTIEVTVKAGEIIVLDTNRWYHSTLIVSDDMSITIGAEYD